MKELTTDRLIELFIRGKTKELSEVPLAAFLKSECVELLVAALVLSGDFDRALALGAKYEAKDKTGVVAFYLALGFARAGRDVEAEKRIHRLDAMEKSGLVTFYALQARGFQSFTHGESTLAIELARRALAAAEESEHDLQPLARILSLDLLGHSLIRRGENRRGLKTLRLAREAAVRLGHDGFTQAIMISLLKYEAIFGFEPARLLSRLSRALVELQPADSYSRSELRLELARQLILRGQTREARRHLDSAAAEILGSQNHLQTAFLHLRLAWLARLEARPGDALIALRSAEVGLNADRNHDLLTKISLFRSDLQKELGRPTADATDVRTPAAFADKLQGVDARMWNRRQSLASTATVLGDDPFGDMMDRLARREVGVETELLTKNYFGLLLPYLGIHLAQTAIILGAPSASVLVFENGESRVTDRGLKGLLGKLLLRLAEGACSRHEAVESIWGHRYEAERHDRLLAVAVSRIRKTLGGGVSWIEIRSDRLSLAEGVVVRTWSKPTAHSALTPWKILKTETAKTTPNQATTGLRIRQLQVLDELAARGDVGVQDLVEKFGISRASALRDLNELVEMKLVVRMGETRATRYMKRN